MKRAVILHSTGASPGTSWFPWARLQLENRGYHAWVPELPNSHAPDRRAYNDFLLGADWDFTGSLVIGHSSGAVSKLNLLADERCPPIETAVLVSAWSDTRKANLDHDGLTREQFKDLLPPLGFDFETINQKAQKFLLLHGDDDAYCPLDQARRLAGRLNGELVVIPGGGHLGSAFHELPELMANLEERRWL